MDQDKEQALSSDPAPNAHTETTTTDEATIPLQQLVEQRKGGASDQCPAEPLQLTLRARRNDLTMQERKYVRSIGAAFGGHRRFDYVSETAKFIYRCPLSDCVNKYGPHGQPVNSNGL